MVRGSSFVAFVAGAIVAGALVSTGASLLTAARADGTPGQPVPVDPVTPTSPGRTVNPDGGTLTRGPAAQHQMSEGSNSRAIAIATQAGGENVVFYFDTELERMLVYQYLPGDRGGLRLRAARHIDYDLKLEDYRGLGDSRDDIKAAYDAAFARPNAAAGGGRSELPVKKVDLSGGK
jgi:hypothetical protein